MSFLSGDGNSVWRATMRFAGTTLEPVAGRAPVGRCSRDGLTSDLAGRPSLASLRGVVLVGARGVPAARLGARPGRRCGDRRRRPTTKGAAGVPGAAPEPG